MDDLISRRAELDALDCINGVEEVLKSLPSVQPEPQEGHWIWVAGDLECSECHTRYPDLYPDYDNSVACPHCGARMKGAAT